MALLKYFWVNFALSSGAETERLPKAWQESLIASANFSAVLFSCFWRPASVRLHLPVSAL